ncbi:preprotein translocase subunit SecE [Candidatus Dependentiae bacterium]|nr:preprotein translocase subunit SecE [Candidatus Dependentiae bacterium]
MKQVGQFLKEVKAEFARVEWPKFDEFVGALIVSLLFMTFFAIYLGIVDRVISWIARQVFKPGI